MVFQNNQRAKEGNSKNGFFLKKANRKETILSTKMQQNYWSNHNNWSWCSERNKKNLDKNKSPGPDGIHPRLLKELVDLVCKPITSIMNMSMTNGCLPGDWKTAHIIPIYKNKGDKNQAVNYQPIAIHRLYAKCITLCIFSSRKNSHPLSSMASSKIDLRQLNFLILSINAVK